MFFGFSKGILEVNKGQDVSIALSGCAIRGRRNASIGTTNRTAGRPMVDGWSLGHMQFHIRNNKFNGDDVRAAAAAAGECLLKCTNGDWTVTVGRLLIQSAAAWVLSWMWWLVSTNWVCWSWTVDRQTPIPSQLLTKYEIKMFYEK